jgi:hypothetical protein
MDERRSAASRYAQLDGTHYIYWQRARDASKLTIPTLYPPMGHTETTNLPTPYQSIGARGVNNLSSKLLLALFPPNTPFFRLEATEEAETMMAGGDPNLKSEIEAALSKIERTVQTEIESTAVRPRVAEAIKHLIVAGNVLIYMLPKGGIRYFPLTHYRIKRDRSGTVLEVLVKEHVAEMSLPDAAREIAAKSEEGDNPERNIDLYTWVRRTDRHWTIHQEVCGEIIPGTEGNYPIDKCPWLALRWVAVDGEDYGRGFVEEYQGDLQSLEGLTQSIVEGTAIAVKSLTFVNPNGVTKLAAVSKANNGAVIAGRAEDVTSYQSQKQADLSVADRLAQALKEDLSYAFMLNSSIQRKGERVTAEEIRYMAQELETSLGGLYSILSQEFQLPFITVLMGQMQRRKALPALPQGMVKPAIVTGLEALGRGNDLSRLDEFVQPIIQQPNSPLGAYLIPGEYLARRATAIGIDPNGLVKTDQQLQQEQQQQMQQQQSMQLAQAATPHAVKGIADGINQRNAQAAASQSQGPSQGQ